MLLAVQMQGDETELTTEVQSQPSIPVPAAEQGRMIEPDTRRESRERAGSDRFDPPAQLQTHATRRIVQNLLERDPDRPHDFDHAPGAQHIAEFVPVTKAARRQAARLRELDRRPAAKGERAREGRENLASGCGIDRLELLPA